MKVKTILIALVFATSLLFRFVKLTEHPVHLTMDEASIAFNAYSILETGKDEWGESFPLAFRSVGDYKPPVNVYFTALSIKAFGYNEFAVRFPSAFFGSLSAVLMFLILNRLGVAAAGSFFGGLVMAISPWHTHLSRSGYEAVTALFLLLLGVHLFLRWIDDFKLTDLLLMIGSFGLSVWAYHSERVFTPLLFIGLLLIYKKKLKGFTKQKNFKRDMFFASITLLIFAVPFINMTLFTPAVRTRALSTSILRDSSLSRSLHNGEYISLSERVFDNDIYLIYRHWLGKYLNYFDLRFGFWKALFTPPGYPDMGLMYALHLPIFMIGIYALSKSKKKRLKQLLFLWFLLGPLPASLTMNEQHALRALTWLPSLMIFLAMGLGFIYKHKKLKKLIPVYFIFIAFNVLYFVNIYTIQFPKYRSEYWQYGYKQVSLFACQNRENYDEIIVTDTFGSLGPLNTGIPYIYTLFYCKYDPSEYLVNKDTDNIYFRRPNWKEDSKVQNKLLIGSPWDFPIEDVPEGNIIKQIKYFNGKTAFYIVET